VVFSDVIIMPEDCKVAKSTIFKPKLIPD